jgi:hypothetical protein
MALFLDAGFRRAETRVRFAMAKLQSLVREWPAPRTFAQAGTSLAQS